MLMASLTLIAKTFTAARTVKLLTLKCVRVERRASTVGKEIVDFVQQTFIYEQSYFSRGDSGGPLMRQNEKGIPPYWYLAGLVSYGPSPCGMDGWPGVYTRVSRRFLINSSLF